MSYDAVLFDNDGVLIGETDGEVMRAGVRNAFERVGIEPEPADVSTMTAFSALTVDRVREVCRSYDLDPESFWATREREVCAVQREEIRGERKTLFEDFDALESLDSLGIGLGIVSNNQHDTVGFMIDHFELDGRFGTFYGVEPTLDGLRRKKPAPHYLRLAMSDLGAEDVLYVGDRETDVRAARQAGLDAAYIRRHDHQSTGETFEWRPRFEIDSLAALPAVVSGDRSGRDDA
jgi:HAD superfamily hydrolase (TIGR01549 family)